MFANTTSFTFDEIKEHLEKENPNSKIVYRDVTQKNTGNVCVCIYVDGSLAGKENRDGSFRLCNQFC